MYVSFLAGCFRSIRFGLVEAHGYEKTKLMHFRKAVDETLWWTWEFSRIILVLIGNHLFFTSSLFVELDLWDKLSYCQLAS